MAKDFDLEITPELLLQAYSQGIFPMADSADAEDIYWVEPKFRGIFELGQLHLSRSLRRALLKDDYEIHVNRDFAGTVKACADRPETWINPQITQLYQQLHHMGFAHSVEMYRDNSLVGGIYGVSLGSAFFGESMFSRVTNGSKIALTYLMARLVIGGYTLFDTQFLTDHLATMGAIEISKSDYQKRLSKAKLKSAYFFKASEISAQAAIQESTQTS